MKEEYIAIKIKGLDHWLWFEVKKTKETDNDFVGLSGWGKCGAFTEINIKQSEIIGRIKSDRLQY